MQSALQNQMTDLQWAAIKILIIANSVIKYFTKILMLLLSIYMSVHTSL